MAAKLGVVELLLQCFDRTAGCGAGVSPTHVHLLLTQPIVSACRADIDRKNWWYSYKVDFEQALA